MNAAQAARVQQVRKRPLYYRAALSRKRRALKRPVQSRPIRQECGSSDPATGHRLQALQLATCPKGRRRKQCFPSPTGYRAHPSDYAVAYLWAP